MLNIQSGNLFAISATGLRFYQLACVYRFNQNVKATIFSSVLEPASTKGVKYHLQKRNCILWIRFVDFSRRMKRIEQTEINNGNQIIPF